MVSRGYSIDRVRLSVKAANWQRPVRLSSLGYTKEVLTYLIPELLQLVDDGSIALTPAVELSYLPDKAQTHLLEEMRRNDCTPSLSQAIRMKKLYQTGSLSPEDISTIIQEEKANQQEKVSFKTGDLRKFFPKSYSAAQMQETILKLLTEYQRKRQRSRDAR